MATWTAPADKAVNELVTADDWNELLGTDGSLKYVYDELGAEVEGPVVLRPPYPSAATGVLGLSSNTTAQAAAEVLDVPITVTELSVEVTAVGASGTIGIAIFSNDGQTRHINVTSGTISGTGRVSIAVPSVSLKAGVYYVVAHPNSTANITLRRWDDSTQGPANFAASSGLNEVGGTMTITASTMPSTFDPDAGITFAADRALMVRFN